MIPIVDAALSIGGKLIDRLWPDPGDRAKAKLALLQLQQEGGLRELEAQMQVVVAEAKSEHWLTATWRPLTMLSLVAIVVNNYILAPYIALFTSVDASLPIPADLWDLIKIGLGGYIVSRGGEKIVKTLKGGK